MYRKKLIEVALPLEAINKASAKEKSIRHGHPSTLHLWWARRPLATCRAVLFASLVDDPSSHPDQFPTEVKQEEERERLFKIIEQLVLWENINNQAILNEAENEIVRSTGGHLPTVYDPFCGGGSIPLEAQRLGLEAHGSDLNPVAVLITKALIEIPPKHANRAPVNPESRKKGMKDGAYPGTLGLADDVRYYGEWMRSKAQERIGHCYPSIRLEDGTDATIIAWLWARTVSCPNPACQSEMPLVRSFQLSTKKGKEAWVETKADVANKKVEFRVKTGAGKVPTGTVNRNGARCLICGTAVKFEHIRAEAQAGRMSSKLMAIVAECEKGRIYLDPTESQEKTAALVHLDWAPETELPEKALGFRVQAYGMARHRDLFTRRQLSLLGTLCELVLDARRESLSDGASEEYANAIATYLGLLVSRLANSHCTIALWSPTRDQSKNAFSRQAIPMTWDFVEVNPFARAAGDIGDTAVSLSKAILLCPMGSGVCEQLDATTLSVRDGLFCTDPPYYDNIGYADLSDFFYVWLRKSLFRIYPNLFSTLLVPKAQELVATPFRFDGDREKAQEFFESGFGKAMHNIRSGQNSEYPFTIFYAFKQSEGEEEEEDDDMPSIASTGWETMLEGLLRADFQITGTWPMHSERTGRPVAMGTNALASSIVLVCRPRPETASITTRKDFLTSLKSELGPAIRTLQLGNVAPVDLQQAAIGPGMAIFSRYKKVIESDGMPMRVRTALGLINQALDEVLSEQESDYDAETRWALSWFEQNQFLEGLFGDANTLANAKALSVEGLERAGIISARAGKVRLLKREELPLEWNPSDARITVWTVTQQLIYRLATQGQDAAGKLAARVGGMAETARELAYRLYTLCDRNGWAEEAGYYNALVIAWPAIRSQEFTLTGDK
jgi:putative DNA methylase